MKKMLDKFKGDHGDCTVCQINRTRERGLDYKELTHMIMEADKPQDLQSASWDPGELMVQFQSESRGLGIRADGVKFQSESWQAEDPGRTDISV